MRIVIYKLTIVNLCCTKTTK